MEDSINLNFLIKENKRLKIILFLLLVPLFFSLLFIVYIFIYNTSSTSDEIVKFDDGNTIQILQVKDGDCKDSIDGCLADILVKTNLGEYRLNDIIFTDSVNIEGPLKEDSNDPYYALDYGTSNCRTKYLFNREDILGPFSQSGTISEGVFWNNYYIYPDCGLVGTYIEMLSGVSALDLENSSVTELLIPSSYTSSKGDFDEYYQFLGIENDQLIYEKCVHYGYEPEDNCSKQLYNLNNIFN